MWVFFSWALKIYGSTITFDIAGIKTRFLMNLVQYSSPTIVFIAINYLIIFMQLQFNDKSKKLVNFLGKGSFAVFILNNDRFLYDKIIYNFFKIQVTSNCLNIFMSVTIYAFLFTIGCTLIDYIRRSIFRVCRIDKLAKAVDNTLQKIISK